MIARRGSVLLAVMVLVVVGALLASASLVRQRAIVAAARAAERSVQSRALALSGLAAVLQEARAQRRSILRGEEPRFTQSWTLYDDDLRRGIVRLQSLDGRLARSESALLDANTASREELLRIESIDEAAADRIIESRGVNGLRSIDELELPGAPPAPLAWGSAVPSDFNESAAQGATAPPVHHLLTVWSFDSAEQSGVGPAADSERWAQQPRINFNRPWSDELAEEVRRRYGDDAVELVRRIFESGQRFTSRADLVDVLAFFRVEPAQWGESLDVVAFDDQPFVHGRIDLNRAPAAVLAVLPGIDRAAADRMVEHRELLDADQRLNLAWPVQAGILTPEQFKQCADRLTTRSLQWRVRIEAGVEVADDPGAARSGDTDELPLRDRIVLEAVVDLSSAQVRIAELRDVTHEAVALRVMNLGQVEPDEPAPDLSLASDFVEEPVENLTNRENPGLDGQTEESGTSMDATDDQDSTSPSPPGPDAPPAQTPVEDRRHGRWRGG